MRISVAMAAYRGERFIGEQLESIAAQSLIPSEIVVCDDSPDDRTEAAVMAFAAAHPDLVRYFRNDRCLGVVRNFEKAVSLASGDFIFLSDQDDVWLPEKIEKMMAPMFRSDRPAGVFCDSFSVDEALLPLGVTHWRNRGFGGLAADSFRECGREARLAMFLKRVPAAGHDMAFDARLREILLPFPELDGCHDTWIGLVLAALDAWEAVDEPQTLFRQHGGNVSASGGRMTWLRRYREAKASIRNNSFGWHEALFGELIARVRFRVPAEMLHELERRMRFSAARARMNVSFLRRLPLISGELKSGRYFRYGRGWQNVIQDLFLR